MTHVQNTRLCCFNTLSDCNVQLDLEILKHLYAAVTISTCIHVWCMYGVCVLRDLMTGIYAVKATTMNFLSYLSLQVIPLHVLVLPTSALTGTSSSPVTMSMRPLSPMCGTWMECQWNMMEESFPSTMVMDLSLSWMSVKVDMLGEKTSSNAV